jgi:hypothetical protein
MNELAYMKLILSIYYDTSSGKVAFNLVKGCKSKDCAYGYTSISWDRLRNKSVLSLVRLEKQFRQCVIKKEQIPDILIKEFKEYRKILKI